MMIYFSIAFTKFGLPIAQKYKNVQRRCKLKPKVKRQIYNLVYIQNRYKSVTYN